MTTSPVLRGVHALSVLHRQQRSILQQQRRSLHQIADSAPPGSPSVHPPALDLAVTQEHIKQFQANGVVCIQNCIGHDWLTTLKESAEQLWEQPGPCGEHVRRATGDYFTDLEMAQRPNLFSDFAHRGPSAELAGTLLQSSEVCFLYDQYFEQRWNDQKSSHRNSPAPIAATPWHQDQPYWQITGSQVARCYNQQSRLTYCLKVASVWLPLDPTPPGAAVQFIAGSHRWQEHSPFHFATGEQYEGTDQPRLPDIEAGVAAGDYQVLQWQVCE